MSTANRRSDLPPTEASSNTRQVTMRLRQETIDRISALKEYFEVSSNTDAVVRAIRLTHAIAEEMMKGGRIELHTKDGQVKELLRT